MSETPLVVELSAAQRTIARRMEASHQETPTFWLAMDVDITAMRELRSSKRWGADVPSINDFIIKAAALTLRDFPLFNATFEEGKILRQPTVNIAVAVATDDALLVPVVRDADTLSLNEISAAVKEFAKRARAKTLAPNDMRHGTFTVSNLGMFGVTAFRAIVNQPQVAILAVGALRRVATELDSQVVFRDMTTLVLTCDHRVIYGAHAAEFLASLRGRLDSPEGLS